MKSLYILVPIYFVALNISEPTIANEIELENFNKSDELHYSKENFLNYAASMSAAKVDGVGDSNSFGREVVWAGSGSTKPVRVSSTCIPSDYTVCANPSTGGSIQQFDARALATIKLPRGAALSLICHHISPTFSYHMSNYSGRLTNSAFLHLTPYATVYNEALNDPSAVDPSSGLPLGGSFDVQMVGTFARSKSLANEAVEQHSESYTRSCVGGMVNQNTLEVLYNLPETVAKKFFKNETKIVFHLKGAHNFVDSAYFSYGIRLTAD